MKYTRELIAFNDDDDDLEGTMMYPDLFKRVGLKNEDLYRYDTPLMGFDGRMVIPEGQIWLPVSMEGKEIVRF